MLGNFKASGVLWDTKMIDTDHYYSRERSRAVFEFVESANFCQMHRSQDGVVFWIWSLPMLKN